MSDLYSYSRERHEARVEAERLLLDLPDDEPSSAELAEDDAERRKRA